MVILRLVRLFNGHSFASLMAWDRWERVVYQGALAGLCVILAVERGGILLWMLVALLAIIIAVGFAFKPRKSKPVKPPSPNPDAPPE